MHFDRNHSANESEVSFENWNNSAGKIDQLQKTHCRVLQKRKKAAI